MINMLSSCTRFGVLLISLTLMSACGNDPVAPITSTVPDATAVTAVTLGQQFLLRVGESISLVSPKIDLYYSEVRDWTCGPGRDCIWGGSIDSFLVITPEFNPAYEVMLSVELNMRRSVELTGTTGSKQVYLYVDETTLYSEYERTREDKALYDETLTADTYLRICETVDCE